MSFTARPSSCTKIPLISFFFCFLRWRSICCKNASLFLPKSPKYHENIRLKYIDFSFKSIFILSVDSKKPMLARFSSASRFSFEYSLIAGQLAPPQFKAKWIRLSSVASMLFEATIIRRKWNAK